MSTIAVITDRDELERVVKPAIEAAHAEYPGRGNYIAVVERDDVGNVLAYQLIQIAVFLEGLWSNGKTSNPLKLHRTAVEYLRNTAKAQCILTMTAKDERGERLCRIVEREGFEKLPVNVLRRVF